MTRSLPSGRARPRETGETLIELLISVSIMGAVIAVVIGALTSIVASAQEQRTDVKAQAVLTSFAERAKAIPLIPCATPAEYNDRLKLTTDSPTYQAAVTKVAWWSGSGFQTIQTTLTAPVDALGSTTTVQVAPLVAPAAFPDAPFTIKVGSGPSPETMKVTNAAPDGTLTVARTTPVAHSIDDDGVTVCPPSDNKYDLQLLDLAVTGPSTGIAGKTGPYGSTMSVSKRGPLLIPTLTTVAGTGGVGSAPPIVTAGATINDAAALTYLGTPPSGVNPTGTMTFRLFPPADTSCVGDPVFSSSVDVTGFSNNDAYISGNDVAFLNKVTGGPDDAPGVHHWTVSYSGDAAFQGASSVCGADGQSVNIEKATPTLTAKANPDTAAPLDPIGADDAALSGGVGPDPGSHATPVPTPIGKITFALYGPNDEDCSHDPLYPAMGDPAAETTVDAGNGTYDPPELPAPPPKFPEAGTYHWVATYSGDVNNEAASTNIGTPVATCGSNTDQTVTVASP